MASENHNNFEEEWQKAFENASFSPPNDMWDRIERELDEKKRRPFLFFMRPSSMIAGMAASLILVLGGILFFNKNLSEKTTDLAQNNTTINNLDKTTKQIDFEKSSAKNTEKQDISSENKIPTTLSANAQNEVIALNNDVKPSNEVQYSSIKTAKKGPETLSSTNKTASKSFIEKPVLAAAYSGEVNNNSDKNTTQISDNQQNNIQQTAGFSKNLTADLKSLKYKEYLYFGSRYTLKREKLVFDTEIEDAPIMASNDSKFWVGLQSGVSPFDPNMKLGGLNAVAFQQAETFALASNMPSTPSMGANPPLGSDKPAGNVVVSQPQNAIKAGVGINTGIAFGYKIAKKLNLESGIRYLRGNSTLQTNTYAFQQNGYSNTFLADYLLQNSNSVTTKISSSNTVVADASQFGNRYEYLMIPMQLGYEIGITKNLGFNILAGVSADVFLQNTIINDNSFLQEKSVINNSSQIYKPLNISGLGGVRATYLISKHWQATLGSSYQQSLFSGINSSTALQMRIRLFGVNYGVNYRF